MVHFCRTEPAYYPGLREDQNVLLKSCGGSVGISTPSCLARSTTSGKRTHSQGKSMDGKYSSPKW